MIETTIINSSGHALNLKEGRAGVFQLLTRLSDGHRFVLKIDLNATYRDYIAYIRHGSDQPTTVFFSIDECIKYKVLTVVKEASVDDKKGVIKPGSKYGYNREERSMKVEASESVPWWRHPWKCLRDRILGEIFRTNV